MNDFLQILNMLDFSNMFWQILTPLLFSLADIISGYIQALINKDVDSQKMRSGLLHKTLIILVIILSFIIQFTFNINYISKVVSIYVILMEAVSILENLKKAGINLGKLGNILKEKQDITENVNNLINKVDSVIEYNEKEENENDERN